LRLLAALSVLVGHCWPLTGTPGDPLFRLVGYYSGNVGLAVFFVLSGLLVARSVERHSTGSYLVRRCLRILPALAAVLTFEIFAVGPIFYDGSIDDYFSRSPWTRYYNLLLFGMTFNLRGVFEGNPLQGVNGSAWTLAVEATFYLMLPILAFLGLMTRRATLCLFLSFAAGYAGCRIAGYDFYRAGPVLLQGVALHPFLKWGSYFFLGVAFWTWRDRVRFEPGIVVCCLLILLFCRRVPGAEWALLPCGGYVILYAGLGCGHLARAYDRVGDLSYGLYIYAWPIQQWIVAVTGNAIGPWSLAAITVPVVGMLAFASWHLLERPALSLAGDRFRDDRGAGTTRVDTADARA
jgi:peptidoglycan/LPS O-acetylase OafA/YrhL